MKGEWLMWKVLALVFIGLFNISVCFYLLECKKIKKLRVEQAKKELRLNLALKNEKSQNLKTYNALVDEHESELKKITEQFKNEVKRLQEYNTSLQNGLDLYKEQHRRALILHPDLENEIDRMIKEEIIRDDIAKANEFDELASRFISRSASRYIAKELEQVLSAYNRLTNAQKHYVMADVQKLFALYESSFKLQSEYLRRKKEEEKQLAT